MHRNPINRQTSPAQRWPQILRFLLVYFPNDLQKAKIFQNGTSSAAACMYKVTHFITLYTEVGISKQHRLEIIGTVYRELFFSIDVFVLSLLTNDFLIHLFLFLNRTFENLKTYWFHFAFFFHMDAAPLFEGQKTVNA